MPIKSSLQVRFSVVPLAPTWLVIPTTWACKDYQTSATIKKILKIQLSNPKPKFHVLRGSFHLSSLAVYVYLWCPRLAIKLSAYVLSWAIPLQGGCEVLFTLRSGGDVSRQRWPRAASASDIGDQKRGSGARRRRTKMSSVSSELCDFHISHSSGRCLDRTIYTIVVGIWRSRNFLGAQFRTSVSELAWRTILPLLSM